MPLTLGGSPPRAPSGRGLSLPISSRAVGPARGHLGREALNHQGERMLIQSGMRGQKRKRKVDSVGRGLVLQSYLDAPKEKCQKGK